MIHPISFQKNHFNQLKHSYPSLNSRLFEKAIRALSVLEILVQSGKPLIFKGGTALMLLTQEPKRLSIDIDIIMDVNEKDQTFNWLTQLLSFEYEIQLNERVATKFIQKEHYKVIYTTVLDGEPVKDNVLIDIVYEPNPYTQTQKTPIQLPHIFSLEGEATLVKTPTLNAIIGDKLTAFAPNTIGVPYYKQGKYPSQLEVLKQLYDVANAIQFNFQNVSIQVIRENYLNHLNLQNTYNDTSYLANDTLRDSFNSALCLLSNGKLGSKEAFDNLLKGKNSLIQYLFFK